MIDPNIALQYKPAQFDNPIATYGHIVGLQNAQQQQQMGALQLEQAKRDQASQQALQDAYIEAEGDPVKTASLAAQKGANPSHVAALQKNWAQAAEAAVKLSAEKLALNGKQSEIVSGAAKQLLDIPDMAQQDALYPQLRTQVLATGVPPDKLPPVLPPDPTERAMLLKRAYAGARSGELLTKEAQAAQEAQIKADAEKRAAALAPGALQKQGLEISGLQQTQAQNQLTNPFRAKALELGNKKLEQEVTGTQPIQPEQQARIDEMRKNKTEAQLQFEAAKGSRPNATDEEKENADVARKALNSMHAEKVQVAQASRAINTFTLPSASNGLSGRDLLDTLPPDIKPTIEAMMSGAISAPPAGVRSPEQQKLRRLLLQVDPSFTEERAKLIHSLVSGKEGAQIGNINTAVVHLSQMGDAFKELKNGNFTPGNAAYNAITSILGYAPPQKFDAMRDVLAGEMARGLTGSATIPEIKKFETTLRKASSPDQADQAINEFLQSMGSKLNTYQQRIKDIAPTSPVRVINTPAKLVFASRGIDPESLGSVNQPGKGIPEVKSQADFDKLPKGAKFLEDGKVLIKQ